MDFYPELCSLDVQLKPLGCCAVSQLQEMLFYLSSNKRIPDEDNVLDTSE